MVPEDENTALQRRLVDLEAALANAAAVYIHLDGLVPWKDNPRDNTPAIEPVARSIQALGFGAPVIARRRWNAPLDEPVSGVHGLRAEIIAGHTRVEAVRLLLKEDRAFRPKGMETISPGFVPVRFMDHLDDESARLLAIADNKLNEVARWTEDALITQLRAFRPEVLPLTGFSTIELKAMMADFTPLGPGPQQLSDGGMQRFLVRVPIGQVARAKELVAGALTAAGLQFEIGK